LTGGLEMVMTATPSSRTSMVVVPLAISGNGGTEPAPLTPRTCAVLTVNAECVFRLNWASCGLSVLGTPVHREHMLRTGRR
jgi:hypothetical protein